PRSRITATCRVELHTSRQNRPSLASVPVSTLITDEPEYISEILETENSCIRMRKAKNLKLGSHALEVLPKLCFHQANEMEEFVLDAYLPEHIAEILKEENFSIWIGKVKKLKLGDCAIQILPRLGFHEENEIEELRLSAGDPEQITEILEMGDKSIWIGKVWDVNLEGYAEDIENKLDFTEMDSQEEDEDDS
ncbi:MAG: uncharacterized protein A8A55_2918, partial [Amphiamblys sp. WSBS2006]